MICENKTCSKCGDIKEITQFNTRIASNDGHQTICRLCDNEASTNYRRAQGQLPMTENKECTSYLGVAVAERLIRHLFKDVTRMPNNNPGFDFICAKDQKIDVKSSCITLHHKKNPGWVFHIKKNIIADYFLLLAFNNREDLEPQHQWLIPGHVVNHLMNLSPYLSTIDKWDAYRQPIGPAISCCNTIKNSQS